MPTFVINDEKQTNSYGFRIPNAGIDLTRFKSNPVMLNDHWNSTRNVVGNFSNIRIEGSKLLADSNFDLEDPDAARLAGKVDRGFIKACSMGVTFNREFMKELPTGEYELSQCELMEVSLVAVPSNANAITLYSTAGVELKAEEVKLAIQEITEVKISKKPSMEKFLLTAVALTALGLANSDSPELVSEAIAKLKAQKDAADAKVLELQGKIDKENNERATALIDAAIDEGKLTATDKESFLEMAKSNYAMAAKVLSTMPAKKSLAGSVSNPAAGASAVKTEEDFMKLSQAEQLAFKAEHPAEYRKLFA